MVFAVTLVFLLACKKSDYQPVEKSPSLKALDINQSAFGPNDFSYAGEARHKDESAYIPGSYDHIYINRSPNGVFELEVMARGDVVRMAMGR